jgi:hypothetical protein
MKRALWFSALLAGVLAVSSQADARMGGIGGFGGGFSPGFRGFSGSFLHAAPSGHFANGSHRQFFPRRQFFAAQHFHGLRKGKFSRQLVSCLVVITGLGLTQVRW